VRRERAGNWEGGAVRFIMKVRQENGPLLVRVKWVLLRRMIGESRRIRRMVLHIAKELQVRRWQRIDPGFQCSRGRGLGTRFLNRVRSIAFMYVKPKLSSRTDVGSHGTVKGRITASKRVNRCRRRRTSKRKYRGPGSWRTPQVTPNSQFAERVHRGGGRKGPGCPQTHRR